MSGGPSPIPMETAEVVTTRTARIWLAEDGIMRYETLPDAEDSLADIQTGVAAVWQLSGQAPVPLLVDLAGSRAISREARAYLSSDAAARTTCGVALLANSPVSRIIGTFFFTINRPPFPLRLFTSKTQALDWLHHLSHQKKMRT
jgi:hypothetical protein